MHMCMKRAVYFFIAILMNIYIFAHSCFNFRASHKRNSEEIKLLLNLFDNLRVRVLS